MAKLFLVLSGLLGIGLAPATVADAAPRQLVATVGPDSSISLRTTAGRSVTSVAPGAYRIVVRDRSRLHNFHLIGPTNSTSNATGVRFVGTTAWRLRLTRGMYRFLCDRHARSMRGTFRIR